MFTDKEDVSGVVKIKPNGKPVAHEGIKIECIGQIGTQSPLRSLPGFLVRPALEMCVLGLGLQNCFTTVETATSSRHWYASSTDQDR